MQLDIVVRGQSNAAYMIELNNGAGAQRLVSEVQRLLGFDGVNDRVNLVYDHDLQGGETVYPATSFLGEWMVQNGSGNWQPGAYENGYLSSLASYREGNPNNPVVVLWMHSEYDSRDPNLSAEAWSSAVRAEAALTRAVLGTNASYLFVAAHPFGDGTDPGHQAIRQAMEALADDAGFNARIAARAPDINADYDDQDGNPATREYGFAHISASDGFLIATRAARAIAEEWAAYAKPGSIVANASGAIATDGPRVVAATRVDPTALRVDVLHDAASSFAGLDPDAAAGQGWSLRLPDGRMIQAVAASILDSDSLIVRFAEVVPEGAVLDYAYGIGRVADGHDEPGQGNAVTDTAGLPAWTPATGVQLAGVRLQQGDFDGDGHADVLWRHSAGTVAIWEMNGIFFSGGGNVPWGSSLDYRVAAAGDFNADGRDDILWRGKDGSVAIWQMDGLNPVGGGIVGLNPGNAWQIVASADFNADGRDDILWRGVDGSVCVWEMNGTAIIGGGIVGLNPGMAWQIAGAGDFNGDGLADILWRGNDGSVCIWQMAGAQIVGGGILVNWAGLDWTIVGTGDFDGDLRSDILWRGADGSVAIWQMEGTRVVGGGLVGLNPGTQWQIEGTGDFNADGRDDILWRDTAGNVVIWEMQGSAIAGGGFLPIAPGHDWQIQG